MRTDRVKQGVRLLGENLAVGESTHPTVCPTCRGGRTHERSFSVTRQAEGLLWNCYRASCGEKGFLPTATTLVPADRPKEKPLRPYYHAVRQLDQADEDYFYERFGLVHTHNRIFTSDFDEYVLPVFGPDGVLTKGYTVRQPTWSGAPESPRKGRSGVPKARVFPHATGPMQSFYGPPMGSVDDGTLVVVEDQISAMAVAEAGHNAVALLGTIVNNDKVREWSLLKPKQVLIALDKDATDKAFAIARKWGLAFPETRVVMLERDLKDEDPHDIPFILGTD